MNLLLDSSSLYSALVTQVSDWSLAEHVFDPEADEVRVSYDIGGSGRIALTVAFELTKEQMAAILGEATPADG